jgi:hypothetical protein
MVLIVQNAVAHKDLGVATAGLSFLRSLGGVMGSAALGAIYSSRVETLIPRYVGPDALAAVPEVDALQGRPTVIRALDEPIRSQVIRAFSDSITTAVRWAIPAILIGFIVFLFLPNVPLRSRFDSPGRSDARQLRATAVTRRIARVDRSARAVESSGTSNG